MRRATSNLIDQAASVATDKALQMASGYLGAKAGELAGHAVHAYAPEIKRQLDKTARVARRSPAKAFAYAMVGAAVAAGLWVSLARLRRE